MKKHLAIMDKTTIEAVLSGRKIIETRFSQHRIAPFGKISVGDIIYMKPPGEDLMGQFKAKKIFYFEGLNQDDVDKIFADFGPKIRSGEKEKDEKYHLKKRNSFYGTLIFISESERFITSPVKIKKKDLRGWVVLG
jgi:ASC-1-like (ASCH) protein